MNETDRKREVEMFETIMEEIRYIRKRLDDHIDEEKSSDSRNFGDIKADIHRVREEMASRLSNHETKLGVISSGIALIVAATISWAVSAFGK